MYMCVYIRDHKKLILILYCLNSRKYLQLNSSKKSRVVLCRHYTAYTIHKRLKKVIGDHIITIIFKLTT